MTRKKNLNWKKSTNLTLAKDVKKKAGELKKAMNRPSISNVIEALVRDAYEKEFERVA